MRGERDPERIGPILDAIGAAWEAMPDQRLGQLLLNATRNEACAVDLNRLWNIEESALVTELQRLVAERTERPR